MESLVLKLNVFKKIFEEKKNSVVGPQNFILMYDTGHYFNILHFQRSIVQFFWWNISMEGTFELDFISV